MRLGAPVREPTERDKAKTAARAFSSARKSVPPVEHPCVLSQPDTMCPNSLALGASTGRLHRAFDLVLCLPIWCSGAICTLRHIVQCLPRTGCCAAPLARMRQNPSAIATSPIKQGLHENSNTPTKMQIMPPRTGI